MEDRFATFNVKSIQSTKLYIPPERNKVCNIVQIIGSILFVNHH